MDKYSKITTNLKKYARKYGNRVHVKTQIYYRNVRNVGCEHAINLFPPKQHWFKFVHLLFYLIFEWVYKWKTLQDSTAPIQYWQGHTIHFNK